MSQFIKFIKDEKEKQGITDYRLSKMVDVPQASISRWLRELNPITMTNYVKICKALKVKEIKFVQDNKTITLKIK